jgi:Peptidase family S41
MKRILVSIIIFVSLIQFSFAQNFGNFTKIKKEKLINDLEILYQGLDKFHSGMYWYTPKDSVNIAFQKVREKISKDLNVLEFHKLIAPLVALTREDHTNIYPPKSVREQLITKAKYLPFTFVFLGKDLYCVKNASDYQDMPLEGKQVESINGETPTAIVDKIGNLFASDGFIKTVKYSDLKKFSFSRYYFYYYGLIDQYNIKFKDIEQPIIIKPLGINDINNQLRNRYKSNKKTQKKDLLEFKILKDSIAYLGIHTFDNGDIKKESKEKNLKSFLENSFKTITDNNIKTLIIDVSKNTGGSEGNEGLVYSYLGDNYKKYKKVRVKTQTAILDNGVDKPIKLKALGGLEKTFANKKNKDGSLERKEGIGFGLMAYKKEPKYKFKGKTYVIISPVTYSGGSEFSNMIYTKDLATFVGQETGGGYLGNTSGYSKKLVLPNSKIEVYIPALQFIMNVDPKLPFGSGVKPDFEVIPTFEEYINGENASLNYILEVLEKED